MAVKIIVSDLDGTLMAPDHLTVTAATKAALIKANDAGIRIAIATGRTLSLIKNVTDQIPFADYVICSNGACVYDRNAGEFIYTKLIPADETAAAVTLLNSLPIYYNVYLEGRIYVQKGSERFFVNPDMPQDFIEKFVASTVQCDDLLESIKGKGAELIDVFAADPAVKDGVLQEFRSKGYEIASAAPGVNSATAAGVNKGAALLGMCERLGITPDEAMAFGDAENDAPMLRIVGLSFAMANGTESCKLAAKAIAPSNAEDGVAQMINKYALNI